MVRLTDIKRALKALQEQANDHPDIQARQVLWGPIPDYDVVWNSRLRTTSGRACFCLSPVSPRVREARLEFNPHVAKIPANQADYVRLTVPHEFAHILAAHYYAETSHGRRWREIMQKVFETPASLCHQYVVPEGFRRHRVSRGRPTKVTCRTCGCVSRIGPIQYKRWRAGTTIYRCPLCRLAL